MIVRLPGSAPTRSRAVIHDNLVFTVAVSPDKTASYYEQTKNALARIDQSLVEADSGKARILTAIVYIADMQHKAEMNRAWDEWVDAENAPMRACIGAVLEGNDLVEIVVTAAK
jgi:enamine deaminase RidA (YjgF/YER057c/UK114 family)